MKEKISKYLSVGFLVAFFILITIVGLRDCEQKKQPEPEQFVLVDDIIFEVFMEELYE